MQAAQFKLNANFSGNIFRAAHLRRHRAAQHRDARPRALAQPRAVQLMMPGGGSEVPKNWFIILRQQSEAIRLVLRPCADVRGRQVAHIVHVKAEERAHFRLLQQSLRPRQPLASQTIEVHSLFPIHRHRSVSRQCHKHASCTSSGKPRMTRP